MPRNSSAEWSLPLLIPLVEMRMWRWPLRRGGPLFLPDLRYPLPSWWLVREKEIFHSRLISPPCSVCVSGVNMLDHDELFRQLRSRIVSTVSPHVVQLQSETCSTGQTNCRNQLQYVLKTLLYRHKEYVERNSHTTNSVVRRRGEFLRVLRMRE